MRAVGALSVVLLVAAAALTFWTFCSTVKSAHDGWKIQHTWKPLAPPYTAQVVAFADRGGVKVKATSPVVEIIFPSGEKQRFTSSTKGTLHFLGIGDRVSVLTTTGRTLDRSWQVYELNDSYELWGGYVAWVVGIFAFVIGVPAWAFRPLRFRR